MILRDICLEETIALWKGCEIVIMPKCVMFDLGGTILEGEFNPIQGNAEVLKNANNPRKLTPEQLQVEANKLDAEMLKLKNISLLESTTTVFQRLLFALNDIEVADSPYEIEKKFWDSAYLLKPTVGIVSLLKCFQDKSITCSIISNIMFSSKTILAELEKHNLLQFFHSIICSSDYGFRKPSNKLFEVALTKEKCLPKESWYIGDSIEADVKGATNAGMHPIWYNQNGEKETDIESIDQIKTWFELEERVKKEL